MALTGPACDDPPRMLIDRYVFRELLAPTLLGLLVYTSLFWANKFFLLARSLTTGVLDLKDIGMALLFITPAILAQTIPMSTLLGVLIGFSRLSNDTEILAFKASGIGIYHVLPPLVILAFIISLITGYFSIMLIPSGDKAMQQMMYQLAKEKIDKGIKERAFTEALGDQVA